jgi:RimJ/RimL family protein N-acetyltransferase
VNATAAQDRAAAPAARRHRRPARALGQGYATEAARAAIRFGFDELGLDRIVAVTLPMNHASRRVMENCGLSFVGVLHVYGRTQVKYALSR